MTVRGIGLGIVLAALALAGLACGAGDRFDDPPQEEDAPTRGSAPAAFEAARRAAEDVPRYAYYPGTTDTQVQLVHRIPETAREAYRRARPRGEHDQYLPSVFDDAKRVAHVMPTEIPPEVRWRQVGVLCLYASEATVLALNLIGDGQGNLFLRLIGDLGDIALYELGPIARETLALAARRLP